MGTAPLTYTHQSLSTHTQIHSPLTHRRRKILKVGGAEDMTAREKFQTTPTLGQTAPLF